MSQLVIDENHERNPVVLDEQANDSYVNWLERGAVGTVKDQGQCSSGWAFAAAGALASSAYLQTMYNWVDFSA